MFWYISEDKQTENVVYSHNSSVLLYHLGALRSGGVKSTDSTKTSVEILRNHRN